MPLASWLIATCLLSASAGDYFQVTVVDRQTGRGVPLVELSTVNGIRCVTDSNGIVAFNEPGLMGRDVFFYVKSHGYEFPADGFGMRGKTLQVAPGGKARLQVDRIHPAERLYRVTGAGIYRDTLLTGEKAPIDEPLLNAGVLGSDSVLTAVLGGKVYWFWGDTNRVRYPLGNFHTTGATSLLPDAGGLDPARGVNLNYFAGDDGFVRPMAPMPGDGPTWLDALVVLRGAEGRERMFAAYAKVRPPLEIYARGLAEFNPDKAIFERVAEFDIDSPIIPSGHPLLHEEPDGTQYVYFADPFPLLRAPAQSEALRDLSRYEAYTCLKEGSRLDAKALDKAQLDRTADGRLRWGWKRNTPPVAPQTEAKLIESGQIRPEEAFCRLQDVETGKAIVAHRGSVSWNDYRRRWILIAVEIGGASMLGEVWFAEADSLVGPWAYARKIATHDNYSFYNPKQHPQFDQQEGRIIYFEGTYTHAFSGNAETTPRYEYNQIMYRLDLADERLRLPRAVYRRRDSQGGWRYGFREAMLAEVAAGVELKRAAKFFAFDRPREGLVPIYEREAGPGRYGLSAEKPANPPGRAAQPLFYALPVNEEKPPPTADWLYEAPHDGSVPQENGIADEPLENAGRARKRPICRVWSGGGRFVDTP